MASRLFLRSAVVQLRRSVNGGGLPLPDGSGFFRPLGGFSQVGGWAGRPGTGRLNFPGAGRFYSGSGRQSSAWYDNLDYRDLVAAFLPVFIIHQFETYEDKKQLQRMESAAEARLESSLQMKKRTLESK